MLHINSLPEPVLEKILTRAFGTNEASQPLVCRKWREIAHTTCYIRFRETFSYDSDSDASSASDETCVVLDTNISASTPTRCTKHVQIALLWPSNPLRFIEKALDTLETISWPSTVDTLSLSFVAASEDNADDNNEGPYPHMDSKATWTAKEIARMLPKISSLNIRAYTSDSLSESLVVQLADMYSQQLQRLKCNLPLELSSLRFSDKLQNLDLQLDPRMSEPLQVHAETLRTVSLSNVSADLSWCRLISGPHRTVAFAKLESLNLTYAGQGRKGTDFSAESCTLQFPRLRNLSIRNCPTECPVLDSDLPQPMSSVSLHGSFAAIQNSSISQIAAHSLSVTVAHMNHTSMSEFYETFNRIFSSPKIHQSRLQIPRSRLYLDPSKLAWPNITHLVLGDPVEFSTFILLIAVLPQLLKLEIAEITLEKQPYDVLNETDSKAKPFESRIKDLRLYIDTEVYRTPLPAIEYVILRIQSLRRVHLSKDAVLAARVIAKLLEPSYPHLTELTIDHAF